MHDTVYDAFVQRMVKAYANVVIGDPMEQGTLMGPMHSENGVQDYLSGLEKIKAQGGRILYGGKRVEGPGNYVMPTIVEIDPSAEIVNEEIFAPIVYVFRF